MGNDEAIVQAARVSYGNGTKTIREDRALIRYLMRHRHTSPFEMCEIKLHIKLPIFVARQWVRHRTASINEISGRYSVLDSEFYIPSSVEHQSANNKQGRGGSFEQDKADNLIGDISSSAKNSFNAYNELLEQDLAREVARVVLPLSTYTQWYWKVDLHNLLHFLELRLHPHAQLEIREYAKIISDLVRIWVPNTWEAFEDYRLNSYTLSGRDLEIVKALLGGKEPLWDQLSLREQKDLKAVLGL